MTATERIAATLATLSLVATTPAFAADRACSMAPVEADAQIRARWPNLQATVRSALDSRGDVDACAQIAIRLDHATIILGVKLPDGRTAARAVSGTEDVVPTLVALLLLPANDAFTSQALGAGAPASPDGAAPANGASAPATRMVDVTTFARPAVARPRDSAPIITASVSAPPPAPPVATRLGLEFSLATGTRAGDGHLGVALGALTSFDIDGWLLGLEGTAAQYKRIDSGRTASSLVLAVLGGRRFRFEAPSRPTMDVAIGPALAVRGVGTYSVRAQAGSTGGEQPPAPDDGPWIRLVGGTRMNFRSRSLVRPFVGVDGEIALGTWAAAPAIGAPRPPAWTMGAVFGATVGAP